MPIGVIVNCCAVLFGGFAGTALGKVITPKLQTTLSVIFGLCAMALGVVSIVKAVDMPPIILAVIVGTVAGEAVSLESKVTRAFQGVLKQLPLKSRNIDMERYITIVVIFCVSGLAFFGIITEGVTGDATVLFSKAVMDFFTAVIFASMLGAAVSFIAVPQAVIFLTVFFLARFIAPLISDTMMQNFIACGGILTVASGLRIAKIKEIPLANMIPALILVLPFSAVWSRLF